MPPSAARRKAQTPSPGAFHSKSTAPVPARSSANHVISLSGNAPFELKDGNKTLDVMGAIYKRVDDKDDTAY